MHMTGYEPSLWGSACWPHLQCSELRVDVAILPALQSVGCDCNLFCRSQREKENLVADLKSAGASQRVGPRASHKLHALFTATDPLMQLGELGFKG